MKPTVIEVALAAISTACVVMIGLDRLGWPAFVQLQGSLTIGLYPLYSSAAVSGWLLGNLFIRRAPKLDRLWRWSAGVFYLLAPVGPFFLLRAMAPMAQQVAAPLVPWFCAGVIAVFFAVPVTLRPRVAARRPRIGSGPDGKQD